MLHSFPRSHSFLSHPSASQSHGEYKGAENLQCTLPKARKSCSPCKSGSSQGQGRGAGSEPPPAVGLGGLCSEQAAATSVSPGPCTCTALHPQHLLPLHTPAWNKKAFKNTFPYAPVGFKQTNKKKPLVTPPKLILGALSLTKNEFCSDFIFPFIISVVRQYRR